MPYTGRTRIAWARNVPKILEHVKERKILPCLIFRNFSMHGHGPSSVRLDDEKSRNVIFFQRSRKGGVTPGV